MKNLTQLIQEQKEEFEEMFQKESLMDSNCTRWTLEDEIYDDVLFWHTSSLTTIIRNEIERKKLLIKTQDEIDDDFISDLGARANQKMGYNTAITEDIAYWENVLEEVEKNV